MYVNGDQLFSDVTRRIVMPTGIDPAPNQRLPPSSVPRLNSVTQVNDATLQLQWEYSGNDADRYIVQVGVVL